MTEIKIQNNDIKTILLKIRSQISLEMRGRVKKEVLEKIDELTAELESLPTDEGKTVSIFERPPALGKIPYESR